MKKSRSRRFTLLEVMIGITLLAIASTAIFWRIQRMVERKRFDSDVNRFQSTLLSTRSLAINMKMDFRLELREDSDGWNARIICREDPDLIYRLPRFSPFKILFNKNLRRELFVDFYSSGFVDPKGVLIFSKNQQKREFRFPELFYRQENPPTPPLHPSELK